MPVAKKEFQSAVSTDMLGYFASNAKKFRSLIPSEFSVSHAEVDSSGPAWWLKRFVSRLADEGIQVADFHGRTGLENRAGILDTMKILAFNPFLLSAKSLTKVFPEHPILLHAPEAAKKRVMRSIVARQPKFLWIENHKKGSEGLQEAKKLVNLYREYGVRSAVMFDGCHFIGAEGLQTSQRKFYRQWESMLIAKQDAIIEGEHVPVSTLGHDGYPLSYLGQDMWKDYARFKSPNLRLRVIENQQAGHLAGFSQKYIPEIVQRNGLVYSTLQKAGVVNFT